MRRSSDQIPGRFNASAICEPSTRQGWSDSFPYKSRKGRVKNGQSEPVRKSCYTHSGAVGSNHRWLPSQIRCSTICVPLYRMQNHRKPVPPVENILPDTLVFPRLITKKKMATREIPISPKLNLALQDWKNHWPALCGRDYEKTDWVFPATKDITKHLARPRVDEALRASCRKLGVEGASTHSFRRSALTQASTAGVPLRHIQALSGHSSLEQLQRYLDVSEDQKKQAAMAFG